MPTEEHMSVPAKSKIGSRPTVTPPVPESGAGEPKGKRKDKGKDKVKGKGKSKRKLLVMLVVIAVVGGAAYWFLLRPSGNAAAAEKPAPVPGAVLVVEPISLNLADGHYLRIGLGLQLTNAVAEAPDAARALDLAVQLYSGRTVDEVISAEGREALRAELTKSLSEAYEGEVMGVYFTDYVTQ